MFPVFIGVLLSKPTSNISMDRCLAPSWISDELDRKDFIFECQCVADLLDHLNPRSGRMPREAEMFNALDEKLSCRLKALLTVDF